MNYDFLICVGLGGNFNIQDAIFFIFPKKEAMQARDISLNRLKGVKKKLWLYESLNALEIETKENQKNNPDYVCDWEIKVNRNKEDFQKWSILKKINRRLSEIWRVQYDNQTRRRRGYFVDHRSV